MRRRSSWKRGSERTSLALGLNPRHCGAVSWSNGITTRGSQRSQSAKLLFEKYHRVLVEFGLDRLGQGEGSLEGLACFGALV